MTLRTDSLWSADISPSVRSPREILEAQADALRQQTDNLLAAEVVIDHDRAECIVRLTLDVAVPGLEGSRYRVLAACHPADRVYPCRLAEGDAAHTHEEFTELVRRVLNSDEIKALALSLLDRARRERRPDVPGTERRHPGHKRLSRPAWAGVAPDGDAEDADAITSLCDEPQGID